MMSRLPVQWVKWRSICEDGLDKQSHESKFVANTLYGKKNFLLENAFE